MERLGGRRSRAQILGVELPQITIPIRLGHNLAVLVEAACRDLQLRNRGYCADDDLIERPAREIRKHELSEDREADTPCNAPPTLPLQNHHEDSINRKRARSGKRG